MSTLFGILSFKIVPTILSSFSLLTVLPVRFDKVDITSVRYAADRIDDTVKFTDDALKMLVKVPRPFLKLVLTGCVNWAKENNCTLISEVEMKIINDKRSKEKKK